MHGTYSIAPLIGLKFHCLYMPLFDQFPIKRHCFMNPRNLGHACFATKVRQNLVGLIKFFFQIAAGRGWRTENVQFGTLYVLFSKEAFLILFVFAEFMITLLYM